MSTRNAPPDDRITNGAGTPVRSRQATSPGGWWFRIRRADGPDGVEMIIAVPGWRYDITRHPDQEAADAAATRIYDEYAASVADKTRQETSSCLPSAMPRP